MDMPASTRSPRLNPFAFPSHTTFRFILLIVSVLGASAFIYDSMFFRYNAERVFETWRHCEAATNADHPNDPVAWTTAFSECRAPLAQSQAIWTLGGMALLLSVAVLIFLALPTWKIWRNRLVLLTSEDAPEIIACLVRLCREIELVHTPIFMCAPLNGTISGLVFGRLGRYFMVLNGGLVTQFYKDREVFRAIVLHELAHLRNADVDKTYFSVAIWQAFVIAAILPFSATLVFPPANIAPVDIAYLINLILRFVALAAMVYLIYKAVLRIRELYADIRASVYDGPTGSLDRVLATLNPSRHRRWGFLQAHPDPNERRQTLADISRLFRMDFWAAFATAAAAMISFSNIYALLSNLTTGSQGVVWGLTGGEFAALGAALIFMPLVGGIVVLGIWRERFAALMRDALPGGVSRLGLALASGAVLGQFLSLDRVLDSEAGSPVTVYGFIAIWAIVLLVYLLFLVQWVANTASAWLEVMIRMPSPRLVYIAIIITSALLLFLIGPMFLLYTLGSSLAQDGDLYTALSVGLLGGFLVNATYLHTILAFISLWAFPLASLFWRKPGASTAASSWVFLDQTQRVLSSPSQATFRIRPALLIGLVGGLLWSGLIITIYAQANSQQVGEFILWLFAFAALAQTLIAAIVAGWMKQLRMVHGVFAAFVAGCVMTGGLIALRLLLVGQTLDAGSAWILFSNVIGMGTLLVLPVVICLSALLKWMGRQRFAT